MSNYKSINEQQILFIGSLFGTKQIQPIKVGVNEKVVNENHTIEVVVGGNGRFINYRIHLPNGETTLWDSWNDIDEVRNTFRMCSF